MTTVAVLGSINLDAVTVCERFPTAGETVIGRSVTFSRGGKGANQAAAAARAGATVTFIGAVGDDGAGERVLAPLVAAGVDIARVRRVPGPTGFACVTVDGAGENTIVVVPGANAAVTLDDGDCAAIAAADVLLLQLEIPPATVLAAARIARAAGTAVLLNPSPVRELPDGLWAAVDAVIVNHEEERALADRLGRVPHVITTLGADGARWRSGSGTVTESAVRVAVVDTTGAGDAFAGALAAAWGTPPRTALRQANAAGAEAVGFAGAERHTTTHPTSM
ncbi:PfkB family carbohydrate kinase [Tsukamurella soli]|uniref:Ribokinase n=1 Tax=Tsukamurella soli TaxID=644556 RepID=A0ABP8JSF0_9ACTN